jgi:hypothetical protein
MAESKPMPIRATKRGEERTPLDGNHDVLICGGSFAGLAIARELAGSGADVMIVDRYEIGERQTSACGIPTEWLRRLGLMDSERQRFDELVMHTPHGDARYKLPWTFSTFDYRQICQLLWRDCDARFETAKVNGRVGAANGTGEISIDSDRGVISAPLVVDALGWRRVLGSGDGYQPPDAPLSRGLEVHPAGSGEDLELPAPGIVTERDLLISVGGGENPDVELVSEHMSESVIAAAPDWSLERAAAEMSRRGVRHLVVFEQGEAVGVLSMRDIVRVWTTEGATSGMTPG